MPSPPPPESPSPRARGSEAWPSQAGTEIGASPFDRLPVQSTPDPEALADLAARAAKGNKAASQALIPLLQTVPLAELRKTGWTSKVMEIIARESTSPGAHVTRYLLQREAELMKLELLGDSPSPAEALIAEQIAVNWMALRAAEIQFEGDDQMDPKQTQVKQNRVESAHRRYLQSVRTLGQLRKLMTPTLVQINVDRRGGG